MYRLNGHGIKAENNRVVVYSDEQQMQTNSNDNK
ncbi:hypothetical protein A1122_01775 [Yersinia pestis A1122]|nr:hypothetical protein A1122_01775 [Yersinia pestis A1122]EKS47645.1 hypothetical protein INS_03364 [Yersinia pestis INS]ERP77498.1 hypothetical protein L327_03190 [Yersinia pestis S3]ERP77622.1 hypothetical protein L328_03205 [Yersinia pestis 24H]ERP78516.1 hypothetical protein L326_03200 [Yersinia pestis 113]ERP84053.1 hypothetical protein L325_03175 [Yersinia pestis 9]